MSSCCSRSTLFSSTSFSRLFRSESSRSRPRSVFRSGCSTWSSSCAAQQHIGLSTSGTWIRSKAQETCLIHVLDTCSSQYHCWCSVSGGTLVWEFLLLQAIQCACPVSVTSFVQRNWKFLFYVVTDCIISPVHHDWSHQCWFLVSGFSSWFTHDIIVDIPCPWILLDTHSSRYHCWYPVSVNSAWYTWFTISLLISSSSLATSKIHSSTISSETLQHKIQKHCRDRKQERWGPGGSEVDFETSDLCRTKIAEFLHLLQRSHNSRWCVHSPLPTRIGDAQLEDKTLRKQQPMFQCIGVCLWKAPFLRAKTTALRIPLRSPLFPLKTTEITHEFHAHFLCNCQSVFLLKSRGARLGGWLRFVVISVCERHLLLDDAPGVEAAHGLGGGALQVLFVSVPVVQHTRTRVLRQPQPHSLILSSHRPLGLKQWERFLVPGTTARSKGRR